MICCGNILRGKPNRFRDDVARLYCLNMATIYNLTKFCHASVIPQVRTITRYGTGSVILFNYAESPVETISLGDSVQTGSLATFLLLFALSYGMTKGLKQKVLCVNAYIVFYFLCETLHIAAKFLNKSGIKIHLVQKILPFMFLD